MDINDVTECEFPEDIKKYLSDARIPESGGSIGDLSYAGLCYMKAAEKLQNIGKLGDAGKYYDKAADFYAQAAYQAEQQDKKQRDEKAPLAEQRDRKRNDERIGENWHNAYSCYTRARAAYTQFGFNRYSVGRIYIKGTDALRKANKYHKEFAKGTNWLERLWLFSMKWLCNYGMRPSWLLGWIALVIFLFTVVYYPSPIGFIELRHAEGAVWTDSFWSNLTISLHFSVITFTTLGYGSIYPVGKAAYLFTAFESILGYVFWGLLLVSLARKIFFF